MFENLKNLIDAHQIISFDIFDTLILRAYDKPIDLFKHIEISMKVSGFQIKRQQAEYSARQSQIKNGFDETDIDEIYNLIPKKLQYLKNIEIEQELKCCFQDKYMHDIFNYAIKSNKRVLIASDMYLKKETIENILKKNGYDGYEKLFLSSDTKHSKASGKMFADILEYTKTNPQNILHIGDNQIGDYNIPQKKGIDCWLYDTAKRINSRAMRSFIKVLNQHCDDISISITKSLILNKSFQNKDILENFGYKYAGLMLTGYCSWLNEKFSQDAFNKIIFASRDGYIPMQIFKKFYPDFKTEYFYASRRAYLFAGMKDVKAILEYLVDQAGNGLTFETYWNSLKISDRHLEKKFKNYFSWKDAINEKSKEDIKEFFIKNENDIIAYAKKERDVSIKYFKTIGLLENKVALVDIGWRASIQKNILNCIKLSGKKSDIHGFYLATHPFNQGDLRLTPFLMNQNVPANIAEIINPLIAIFELICSAPHLGCVKMEEKGDKIIPLFQHNNDIEKKRMEATGKICQGVLEFVQDFQNITQNLPISVSPLASVIPFVHFFDNLSDEEKKELSQIGFVTGVGDCENYNPLIEYADKEHTIGVVYTWPGAEPNAEAEFLYRLLSTKIDNFKIVPISVGGFILNNKLQLTTKKLTDNCFNFIISIHYEDVKMLDNFYYHTVWNPPENTLQYAQYPFLMENIISNDDFLIYDDGGMSNHLKAMLIDSPRNLDDASSLTASFPASAVLEPELGSYSLFYCGINWEKMIGIQPRHEGLFKLLDQCGDVCLYGPSETWKGYRSYKGKIPFDGFSLVKEAHKCGVVLALSSDFHYRAGAATNRIYEGCAAGAVIISDRNRFITKHFRDSILYIDFDKENPQKMFNQIKEHLDWIKNNPKEALDLARKSQKIFLEKFTLEKQLSTIIANHEKRKKAIAETLYSRNTKAKTLAVLFLDSVDFDASDEEVLENTLKNISTQIEKNITLAVCCNENFNSRVASIVESFRNSVKIKIIPFKIYDECTYKWLSRGQLLLYAVRNIKHDYLCILDGHDVLFTDHITTLKRILEDNPNTAVAYGGTVLDSLDANRYRILTNYIDSCDFFNGVYPNSVPNICSNFLIRADVEKYLTEDICRYIDGKEVSLLLNMALFKGDKKFEFSKRTTCGYSEWISVKKNPQTISDNKQINFIHGLIHYDYKKYLAIHNVKKQTPLITTHQQNPNEIKDKMDVNLMKCLMKLHLTQLKINRLLLHLRYLFEFRKKKRQRIKEKIKTNKLQIKKIKQMQKELFLCI